jgi:hypothetical protein
MRLNILFCQHTKKSTIKFYLCPLKKLAAIAENWAENRFISMICKLKADFGAQVIDNNLIKSFLFKPVCGF